MPSWKASSTEALRKHLLGLISWEEAVSVVRSTETSTRHKQDSQIKAKLGNEKRTMHTWKGQYQDQQNRLGVSSRTHNSGTQIVRFQILANQTSCSLSYQSILLCEVPHERVPESAIERCSPKTCSTRTESLLTNLSRGTAPARQPPSDPMIVCDIENFHCPCWWPATSTTRSTPWLLFFIIRVYHPPGHSTSKTIRLVVRLLRRIRYLASLPTVIGSLMRSPWPRSQVTT